MQINLPRWFLWELLTTTSGVALFLNSSYYQEQKLMHPRSAPIRLALLGAFILFISQTLESCLGEKLELLGSTRPNKNYCRIPSKRDSSAVVRDRGDPSVFMVKIQAQTVVLGAIGLGLHYLGSRADLGKKDGWTIFLIVTISRSFFGLCRAKRNYFGVFRGEDRDDGYLSASYQNPSMKHVWSFLSSGLWQIAQK